MMQFSKIPFPVIANFFLCIVANSDQIHTHEFKGRQFYNLVFCNPIFL